MQQHLMPRPVVIAGKQAHPLAARAAGRDLQQNRTHLERTDASHHHHVHYAYPC